MRIWSSAVEEVSIVSSGRCIHFWRENIGISTGRRERVKRTEVLCGVLCVRRW